MLRAAVRLLSNRARAMRCVLPVSLSRDGGRWLGASTRMCLGVILMCLGVIGSSAASLRSTLVMDSCYIYRAHILHGDTFYRDQIHTHLDSILVMAGLQAELTKVVALLKCCICKGATWSAAH